MALVPDKPVQTIASAHDVAITTLALSSSGTLVATGDASGKMSIWNFADGSKLSDFNTNTRGKTPSPLKRAMQSLTTRRASVTAAPPPFIRPASPPRDAPAINVEPPSPGAGPPSMRSPNSSHMSSSGSLGGGNAAISAPGGPKGSSNTILKSGDTFQQDSPSLESKESGESQDTVPMGSIGGVNVVVAEEGSRLSLADKWATRKVRRHSIAEMSMSARTSPIADPSSPARFSTLGVTSKTVGDHQLGPQKSTTRSQSTDPTEPRVRRMSLLPPSARSRGASATPSSANLAPTPAPVVRPAVYSIVFSPDDAYMACAAAVTDVGHVIHVWKLAKSQLKSSLTGHTMRINWLAFVPSALESRQLISASTDGSIRFWDRSKARETKVIFTHSAIMSAVILEKYVLHLLLWHLIAHRKNNSEMLVTAHINGEIQCWNTATQKQLWCHFEPFGGSSVLSVISAPGNDIITFSKDGIVRIFAFDNRELRTELKHKSLLFPSNFTRMALSADQSILSVGTADGSILVWNYATKALLALVKQHNLNITGLAWNLGGNLLSASDDRKLVIWDGREVGTRFLSSDAD
ncbi:WD40-repeat-containing domain protein [Blastocladiella britannica]|nr:WD40-repeat-containing domain protein [Blastocladiella britannica]